MKSEAIKWNIDLVRQFVEVNSNSGCKLISSEYVNIDDKLEFQCKCGSFFDTTMYYFVKKNKRQCNPCGWKNAGMKKRLSYSFVKNYIFELGYEIVDKTYSNGNTPLTFKDEDGYYYYIRFADLNNRKKISPFLYNNPYIIDNIKLWLIIHNKNYILLNTEYRTAKTKMLFKCLQESCGEVFDKDWEHIVLQGDGCPYCSGRRVCTSNSLATKNPELAKEWHPFKNESITPYDVTCSCSQEVWWQCSSNPKHEWETSIANRNNRGSGCPYCSGRLPTKENNLLVNNPTLCEEWNYKRNKKTPNQYTPYSPSGKVWWICKECENEWQATISARNSGIRTGCPECKQSKGEKKITEILTTYNFIYEPQKSYDDLIGLGGCLLSYDFYLPDFNLLIEYQGVFHDCDGGKGTKYMKSKFEKQQEHDRRKRNYAQNNNIKLLEIWYYDFDNIETILTDYLNKCNEEKGDVAI